MGGWTVFSGRNSDLDSASASFTDWGVLTARDDVRVIASAADLRAAIAPIDSVDEAVVLLMASGHRPDCDGPNARIALR